VTSKRKKPPPGKPKPGSISGVIPRPGDRAEPYFSGDAAEVLRRRREKARSDDRPP